MKEPKRKFKGVWIPASIWLNPDLTWMEKCFIAEVDSLSDESNACTAGRNHFAKMFQIGPARVSNIVNDLKNRGYLDGRIGEMSLSKKFTESVKSEVHGIREVEFTESVKSEETPNIKGDTTENSIRGLCPRFIGLWCRDYIPKFRRRYTVSPRDAATAKRFFQINPDVSPETLIDTARRAWNFSGSNDPKKWNCARSFSMTDFLNALNKVQEELDGSVKPQGTPLRSIDDL